MKKTTKTLTALATAVALILGASTFVSCSSGSDDDDPPATNWAKRAEEAFDRYSTIKETEATEKGFSDKPGYAAFKAADEEVGKTTIGDAYTKELKKYETDQSAIETALTDVTTKAQMTALTFSTLTDTVLAERLAAIAAACKDDNDVEKTAKEITSTADAYFYGLVVDAIQKLFTEANVKDFEEKVAALQTALDNIDVVQPKLEIKNSTDGTLETIAKEATEIKCTFTEGSEVKAEQVKQVKVTATPSDNVTFSTASESGTDIKSGTAVAFDTNFTFENKAFSIYATSKAAANTTEKIALTIELLGKDGADLGCKAEVKQVSLEAASE